MDQSKLRKILQHHGVTDVGDGVLEGDIMALCTEAAQRYLWLREQHWSSNKLCVVMNPKQAVKLGEYCPSGDLLDKEVDRARGLIK